MGNSLKNFRPDDAPRMKTACPGPKSLEIWGKEVKYISPGLSGSTLTSKVVLDEGYGCLLKDVDDNVYIDFSSGVVMTNPGHSHPKVVQALKDQIDKLQNVHDHAVPNRWKLCKLLSDITPGRLNRSQLYSGGTETIEAAMRMAKSFTKKTEFISFWNGFHGKTIGALGLDGTGFRKGFGPLAPGFYNLPYAYCYRCPFNMKYPQCDLFCADFVDQCIDYLETDGIAAIIAEPIQGAGGTIVPPPGYFERIKAICEKRGILLHIDEILTGFGRTGKMFAIEHYNVEPDILTMGKGMGAGFPVGALTARDEIIEAKPFATASGGSTSFGGNPMACAAALANIYVIQEENLIENAAKIGNMIFKELLEFQKKHPMVGDVRGKGLLITIELVKNPETKERADKEGTEVFMRMLNKGVLSITPKACLRLAPPLSITEKMAKKALSIIMESIEEVEKEAGIKSSRRKK